MLKTAGYAIPDSPNPNIPTVRYRRMRGFGLA